VLKTLYLFQLLLQMGYSCAKSKTKTKGESFRLVWIMTVTIKPGSQYLFTIMYWFSRLILIQPGGIKPGFCLRFRFGTWTGYIQYFVNSLKLENVIYFLPWVSFSLIDPRHPNKKEKTSSDFRAPIPVWNSTVVKLFRSIIHTVFNNKF